MVTPPVVLQDYERLMRWWRLHIAVSDPDRQQLIDIHRSLCIDELSLFGQYPQMCFSNLQERLTGASSLDLDLAIPVWASLDVSGLIEEQDAGQEITQVVPKPRKRKK